jgi:hypothetical protein
MTAQLERTEELADLILVGLESGKTLTSICGQSGAPSISTVQRWQRGDKEFDDDVLRARKRGALVQHDMACDTLFGIMNGEINGEGKELQAKVTAARDVNHTSIAILSKLDPRFKDKQQVDVTHDGPMIIGWKSPFDECPSCGHDLRDITPAPATIEHDVALPSPSSNPTGGDAR